MARRSRLRTIMVTFLACLLVCLVCAGVGLALAWTSFGKLPSGARLARVEASPNYRDGRFHSPLPVRSFSLADYRQMWRDYRGDQQRVPAQPVPVDRRQRSDYASPPASGLRVTWLGHSSTLVEVDGATLLFDPLFSERPSPLAFVGPVRFFPSPLPFHDVPALHAVIISHDHFDHLDRASVVALASRTGRFVVPLGVGAHLEYWGISPDKIVELDWWDEVQVGGVRIVATPGRHFSGRMYLLGDRALWASYAIIGSGHRVFFSGDTGFMPQFAEVGQRLGPFDLTLIKIGAYGRGWPDIHLDPEQALAVHDLVRGRLFLPIHWGTLNLSYHAWTEPVERLMVAAAARGASIAIPRPGEMVEPGSARPPERYWPDIPWERASGP